MAWVAVYKKGSEAIFYSKPAKSDSYWYSWDAIIELPKGSIQKLIGRELTWDDEPVELTETLNTPTP